MEMNNPKDLLNDNEGCFYGSDTPENAYLSESNRTC